MRWWNVRGAALAAVLMIVPGGPVAAQQVYQGTDRGGTWLYIPDGGTAPSFRRPPAYMQPLDPRDDRRGYVPPRNRPYQQNRSAEGWRQPPRFGDGYGRQGGTAGRPDYERPRYGGQRGYRSYRDDYGWRQDAPRYRPPTPPRAYAAGRVYLVPLAADQPLTEERAPVEPTTDAGSAPRL